jgi:hypothetical protein
MVARGSLPGCGDCRRMGAPASAWNLTSTLLLVGRKGVRMELEDLA